MQDAFLGAVAERDLAVEAVGRVEGLNYAEWQQVGLSLYRSAPAPGDESGAESDDQAPTGDEPGLVPEQ